MTIREIIVAIREACPAKYNEIADRYRPDTVAEYLAWYASLDAPSGYLEKYTRL